MSDPEFFKRYGGSAAENYERYFVPQIGRPFALDLIEMAALRPGEHVLDVGCGTGIVARLAKEGVGPKGSVDGLDPNPGMLGVARSVTPAELSISWHEGTAESLPFPDAAFDVVFCQFALQFVPNKIAAVREMRRVLKPGGRLLLNTPGPTPAVFEVIELAIARHIGQEAGGFVKAVFSLHDPAALQTLLSEAGFKDASARPVKKTLRVPPPRDFLWQYVQSTPLAPAVAAVDGIRRGAMERDGIQGLERFVGQDGLILEQGVVVATATK